MKQYTHFSFFNLSMGIFFYTKKTKLIKYLEYFGFIFKWYNLNVCKKISIPLVTVLIILLKRGLEYQKAVFGGKV